MTSLIRSRESKTMANISGPLDVSSIDSNNEEQEGHMGREIQANFDYSICNLEV